MKHAMDTNMVTSGTISDKAPEAHRLGTFPEEEGLPRRYKEMMARQEQEIAQSRRSPFRELSGLLGKCYCLTLILLAGWIQRLKKPRIDLITRRLAEIYTFVPEMALHKAIELQAFSKYTMSGKGIDLGSGNGQVGGILIESEGLQELHGLDFYEHNEALALQNGYAGFVTGDIQRMPLADQSFDYAISVCVLEHVPDLRQALCEAARILKPGGRLVFSTPAPRFRESTAGYRIYEALGLRGRAEQFKQDKDILAQQYHYLTPVEWKALLEETGFEDITVQGIFTRRQLFLYDLMNFQVYWLKMYFADKLQQWLYLHPDWNRRMQEATAVLTAYMTQEECSDEAATHFLIACHRR